MFLHVLSDAAFGGAGGLLSQIFFTGGLGEWGQHEGRYGEKDKRSRRL